jgi:tetratricopeptide (TPR) repeat protein/transglutaminase-like putative cysteine protease
MAQPPASPDPYRNESVVIERSEASYRMHADGTGERDLHVVLRIQSDGAAQQFGVLGFPYASANETPVIKFVRVHKSDGTTVETPVADAMEMPADVTRQAPLYSDLKEIHIPVRSLSPGDKLEYEIDTAIDKPDAPGQFWGTTHFTPPGTIVVLAEVLTLQVPSGKYVQVWSPNHKPAVEDRDGLKTYTWNVAQLVTAPKSTGDDSNKPVPPKDPDEDDQGRKLPSAAWTTFRNWTEVGDWYRGLALHQADPNDMLRARANEITAKAQTPEEQIRAIYDFVSARTRYIGIDFGIGRYQPHTASEVLANQYGDCKDKDTLLEALLRAKGFSTSPALIGAGIAPLPDLPSPAMFNHVITTVNLPSGRIWLDSTPMVSPYRYLVALIRDQKALVVPADGPASLETTPAKAPYPFMESFVADATLDADGKLTAKMTSIYRDDNEILVRALERSVAPAEWDKVSQYISSTTGFGGATSGTQFKNDTGTAEPIMVTYDYSRHPFGDWDNHRIVPLFPVLEFTALESDTTAPQDDIQLGAPRMLTAISHIRLPDGYDADLPDPIHVKTDFATFDKTYLFESHEIIVERDIVILKNKIAKADWKTYLTFTKDISLSGEDWIQLLPPSKTTAKAMKPVQMPTPRSDETGGSVSVEQLKKEQAARKNAPGASQPAGSANDTGTTPTLETRPQPIPGTSFPTKPSPQPPPNESANQPESASQPDAADRSSNESAGELMQEAQEQLRQGDLGSAKETLDEVKEKNPNEEHLWSMYGLLAEVMDRNYEVAIDDFRNELEAHPDDGATVAALAGLQTKAHDPEGARKTLQGYLDRHPDDARLAIYLASLETLADNKQGALRTLEAAAKQNPDNLPLRVQMSQALVDLDRMEEAAAAAKSALQGASDAYVLNDAAYTLSETGLDLDVAEDASRKSIKILEGKSASFTTESASQGTFLMTSSLAANWDTLGWILFKEGKLDAAQSFIAPAWRVSLRGEIGEHLGQIYEAEGKKNKAATVYALAQDALEKNSQPDDRRRIAEGIDRLKADGAKPDSVTGTGALQDLRTFKFPRPKGASGWGTFRLEVTTAGIIESQQITGAQTLDSVKPAVGAMKFPDFLPPDSNAHILLSAVIDCSLGTTCELVLVPNGGLQTERQ